MPGEKDIETLLASMAPELSTNEYVFCACQGAYADFASLSPLASFVEEEGLTLVLTKEAATQANLPFDSVFRAITLKIHSSLDAVGLTAAVSTKLTEHGISANVIAAYYHDHIFVPTGRAEEALSALHELCG